jgi:hypothetical protein
VASDLNGDGVPDLPVADSGDNNMRILLGNGSRFGFSANYCDRRNRPP